MEWVVLAIALLVMAPAAALPLLLSAEEAMDSASTRQLPQTATPVRPALQHPAAQAETLDQRPATAA